METKKTLTIPEAAAVLGISDGLAYRAARTGQLPALRVGRRYVVPTAALEELLRRGWKPDVRA